ncbi:histone-like nucleoid-structuring protein, MvaT/MvaU family [Hahella aquimaris]|uniref:histone-like nucleoid-structuring protein, MvaT/MvaU family n=1 Tax=Hahella sp. HNIBRBA332 TaxID=3015983 RepID=UPI00273CE3F4|nr:histone-like nucleoid-structuring protein, MvaT/MvaU family [Hahella sp. HNIBRBA332]WLQ16659.1 histone-like nucleoid-structuring protein, MvaT/MvaU family [Hahella sp. HNIBRBA332]
MRYSHLQIHLRVQGKQDYYPTLPASVVDATGHVLTSGPVSVHDPAELWYKRRTEPLFVRLVLPNGITQTKALRDDNHTWHDEITFIVGGCPNTFEWMQWSIVRLDSRKQGGPILEQPGMWDAWFQLWEKSEYSKDWCQVSIERYLREVPHSQNAIQLEMNGASCARALVLRLDSDMPQVVALPYNNASVLIIGLRDPSGIDAPQVLIGGYSPDAETILEFLRANALESIESMLEPRSNFAHKLLQDKFSDPVAATAAAYYLLRKRDWERLPAEWLDTLAERFAWIPDAGLINASSRIARGMTFNEAADLASSTLANMLQKGIPLFAEANFLLSDLLPLAEKAKQREEMKAIETIRMMLASSYPAGVSFGFVGNNPSAPIDIQRALLEVENKQGYRNIVEQSSVRNITVSTGLGPEIASLAIKESNVPHKVPGNAKKTLFLAKVFGINPNLLYVYENALMELKSLEKKIAVLEQDEEIRNALEFKKKTDALMAEYNITPGKLIHMILSWSLIPAGPNFRSTRLLKVYRNPKTGEEMKVHGGNDKALDSWKEKYGKGNVENWLVPKH